MRSMNGLRPGECALHLRHEAIHKQPEDKLSDFLGMEDRSFTLCFDANGGLFGARPERRGHFR